MQNRFEIINYLIRKYNYVNYLEIGVQEGICMQMVRCQIKHGVDPYSDAATFKIPSDELFIVLNHIAPRYVYDIIFVDGLHEEEQVTRDILNSLQHLSPNGTIVVHDCNPPTEWHQRSLEPGEDITGLEWNGTAWKSMVKFIATRDDLEINVVDTDWGCGLIRRKSVRDSEVKSRLEIPDPLTYEFLANNRKQALNLISRQEFLIMY